MASESGVKQFFQNNWEKIVMWTILVGLFYLLRPFFLLVFETFLITYITRSAATYVVRRLKLRYRLAVVLVFVTFVGALFAAGLWVGPQLVGETTRIWQSFALGQGDAQAEARISHFIERLAAKVAGDERARAFFDSSEYAALRESIKTEVTNTAKAAVPQVIQTAWRLIGQAWQLVLFTLLAILFSFMLVLDWERIGARVRTLENSRVRTFYLGAAPHLMAFGSILGKALRAQALIAACNTLLTGIGLWVLQVPNVALLSVVVFICGFIPILGTILSSVPILIFALYDGGVTLGLKVIVLIAIVHAFEAYVLNPRITGEALHAHPLIILVLLLVCERFFGVWGMVVGVPIGYYLISVLSRAEDPAAASGASGAHAPITPSTTAPPAAKP